MFSFGKQAVGVSNKQVTQVVKCDLQSSRQVHGTSCLSHVLPCRDRARNVETKDLDCENHMVATNLPLEDAAAEFEHTAGRHNNATTALATGINNTIKYSERI